MKRKIVLLIAILLLISNTASPAMAASPIKSRESQPSFTEQVINLTRDVLLFMEPEQDLYGLSDVDFETLFLGEQIPAYILTSMECPPILVPVPKLVKI